MSAHIDEALLADINQFFMRRRMLSGNRFSCEQINCLLANHLCKADYKLYRNRQWMWDKLKAMQQVKWRYPI